MLFYQLIALTLSFVVTSASNVTTFVLPQGSEAYRTSYREYELVDHSRRDPFNASHARRIMVSRLDPVSKIECKLTKVPYFLPEVARVEDEVLGAYDYPPGLWSRFYLEICKSRKSCLADHTHFPAVLFSGGLNTTRLFYTSLAQEIASHGFTVITIDHPYDTDVVAFPNGDVIYGGRVISAYLESNGSTAPLERALEVRANDASFVLDALDFRNDKAVIFGHSFGGVASATAVLVDKRFRAGINFDGGMFGPVLNTSLGSAEQPQAFMLWGSEGHTTFADATWGAFWDCLSKSPYVDYRKSFSIKNSGHGSYWDINLLVDIAGIRGTLSEKALTIIGPIEGHRVYKVLGRYVTAFFWYTLGLKGEDTLLKGQNGVFPEVVLLNE